MLHCWLYGKNQIWAETKKLIKKYGTRDPFEIMDQMNIVIGETSRYKTLKGYCFMNCKTIHSTIWRIIQNTRPICLLPIFWLMMRRSKIWFRTKTWIISDSAVLWMQLRNSWALNYTAWQNEARLIICRWRFRAISWRNKVNKDPVLYIIVWTGSFYNDLFSI